MMDKQPQYYYIRTKRELRAMAAQFEKSRFRYLHFACHGNSQSFGLTLDSVSFHSFAEYFRPVAIRRRIFLSACEVAQTELAKEFFRDHDSSPYSITGPTENIRFCDAAAIWASVYNLLFRDDSKGIEGSRLRDHLGKLCELNEVSFVHFGRIRKPPYYREFGLSQ
jgi:hypothetical protein